MQCVLVGVCVFTPKMVYPCEQALRSALVARRAKKGELAAIRLCHREDKSLQHFAVVEKFWMTTNPKNHSKSEFALLQTSSILFNSIQLIWQMFANVSQVESEKTVSKFLKKKKTTFLLCSPTP